MIGAIQLFATCTGIIVRSATLRQSHSASVAHSAHLCCSASVCLSQAVYYGLEPGDTVNSHAVVLWNSNMMDVNLSASSLTYKVIGGIIDLYFLLGPTPLIVTEQYTEMVGRPFMPPLYSLGWHQCKWGPPLTDCSGHTRPPAETALPHLCCPLLSV